MESGLTQAVLPLVGLAAEKVIRDRYNKTGGPAPKNPSLKRNPLGSFPGSRGMVRSG
ncbi:MAG: hypothetical protein ACQESR_25530 [Planctomycetota bacterium]